MLEVVDGGGKSLVFTSVLHEDLVHAVLDDVLSLLRVHKQQDAQGHLGYQEHCHDERILEY